MPHHKYWTVRKEESFEQELILALKTDKYADEFISGVEWSLARNPKCGKRVPGTDFVWAIPIRNPNWIKDEFTVYYTFDEPKQTVILLSLARFSAADL
ncbi:MAG: hypothetical protein HY706_09165 [Candidatus Hydrogenedentes bacterium]|nr:hypothetical protein [Candidatus Hydrogenedentota bacterium]